MPHVHPFGPPNYVPFATAVAYLEADGFSQADANIGAAIAMASSTIDTRLIDDTPSLGKYGVGAWQLNYYGSAFNLLTREFGLPIQLVESGIVWQVHATRIVFQQFGWQAWPAYQSGAYRQFLTGTGPTIAQRNVSVQSVPPPSDNSSDSWSGYVGASANAINNIAYISSAYAQLIREQLR